MESMSLFIDKDAHLLIAVAQRHRADPAYLWLDGWRIDATPEQMRDILNDYCRAKIDAKGIEAGEPLWQKWQREDEESNLLNDPNRTAQERRP